MNNLSKYISFLLLMFVLNGQLLQSSVLHFCLNDNNFEILNEENKDEHCKQEKEASCCAIEIEDKNDCDDCYNIEIDNEETIFSEIRQNIVNYDHQLIPFIDIEDQTEINSLLEFVYIDLPPPNYLVNYISSSFLRGPTTSI